MALNYYLWFPVGRLFQHLPGTLTVPYGKLKEKEANSHPSQGHGVYQRVTVHSRLCGPDSCLM